MGGKGGLNILPQKKWNVYNWDNRIKVMENEKIVKGEIEKNKIKQKYKNLEDRVNLIKKGRTDQDIFSPNFDNVDHNKIFKEFAEKRSMAKRLKTEMLFEKMNRPMSKEEQLAIMENEPKEKEVRDTDIDTVNKDEEMKNITFKESIKKHLNPWYNKKKLDDYKEYKEYKKLTEKPPSINIKANSDKLLGKKHKKDDTNNEIKTDLEKLRQERIQREKNEHQRILDFINKNNKK
jgi:hypothetical protein